MNLIWMNILDEQTKIELVQIFVMLLNVPLFSGNTLRAKRSALRNALPKVDGR